MENRYLVQWKNMKTGVIKWSPRRVNYWSSRNSQLTKSLDRLRILQMTYGSGRLGMSLNLMGALHLLPIGRRAKYWKTAPSWHWPHNVYLPTMKKCKQCGRSSSGSKKMRQLVPYLRSVTCSRCGMEFGRVYELWNTQQRLIHTPQNQVGYASVTVQWFNVPTMENNGRWAIHDNSFLGNSSTSSWSYAGGPITMGGI